MGRRRLKKNKLVQIRAEKKGWGNKKKRRTTGEEAMNEKKWPPPPPLERGWTEKRKNTKKTKKERGVWLKRH